MTLNELIAKADAAFTTWTTSTTDQDPNRYSNAEYQAYKAADAAVDAAIRAQNKAK